MPHMHCLRCAFFAARAELFFFPVERTVAKKVGKKWKATIRNSEDTVQLAMVGMATGLPTVQTRCSRVLQWLHHGEQCALWGRLR